MDRDDLLKALQGVLRAGPALVLGSGSSIAAGQPHGVDFPSMQGLADALTVEIPRRVDSEQAVGQWNACRAHMESGSDLETALQQVAVTDDTLLAAISAVVAEAVGTADTALRNGALRGQVTAQGFALSRLLRFLVDGVPATRPRVEVITPNYDHVVEYACLAAGIVCLTGFAPQGLPAFSSEVHIEPTRQVAGRQAAVGHVRLAKPHGSLNWVPVGEGYVELPGAPPDLPRLVVAPGSSKYRLTSTIDILDHHRDLAKRAIQNAVAILFYGYGFRDEHLQTSLQAALARGAPAVVLARELSNDAVCMAQTHRKVWALERADTSGTRVVSHGVDDTTAGDLWNLESFLGEVVGR